MSLILYRMKIISKSISLFNKVKNFITDDIWRMRLDGDSSWLATCLIYLRVFLVSFRRFNEDKVQLRASSLTYYSLSALVPIFAMIFGIAKGFGIDKDLEQKLKDNFSEQQEVLDWIISFAHNMLDDTKGGLIAGVGLAMLFWSVMKMMGNIERSFNDIWQIKKNRSYVRKFTDYISIMLIAPIFIILASSGRVFIITQVNNITSSIDVVNLNIIVIFLIKLFPFLMTWILFTLLYMVMPNTNVRFSSALIAGVLAGTAFLVVQWLYIEAQMGMSRYNVIYGSFAALPLLLIWLRTSWVIVLLGAEVSFSKQNIEQYELESDSLQISPYANRACTIYILYDIVKRFIDGAPPLTAHQLANKLKLPIRLVTMEVADMLACSLISEVCIAENDKEHAYAPAQDVKKYSLKFVFETLDKSGSNHILKNHEDELKNVIDIQENFLKLMENMPENILIEELHDYEVDKNNNNISN